MSKLCRSIEDLPAMLIGSRIIVPKDRLAAWIDNKLTLNELAG